MTDPSAPGQDTTSSAQYEFDEEESEVFAQLSRRLRLIGLAMVVFSLLSLFRLRNADLTSILIALPLLVIGVWTVKAASSFGAVSETQGSDISHLMDALRNLHLLVTLALALIGLVAFAVSGFLAFALIAALG